MSSGKPSRGEVKNRLLTRKNPSAASGIADASVIKDGDIFLLTTGDGSIPFRDNHGYGLYYNDCRYLSGYRIEVDGKRLDGLSSTTRDGFRAVFETTNPSLGSNGRGVPEHTLGFRLSHFLSHGQASMRDELEIRNYGLQVVDVEVGIFLRAGFEDVFNIRGLDDRRPGKAGRPRWRGSMLTLPYHGGDGVGRALTVRFPGDVRRGKEPTARLRLRIGPQGKHRLAWDFRISESGQGPASAGSRGDMPDTGRMLREQTAERARHASRGSEIASDLEPLSAAIAQSLKDLRSLQSEYQGQKFFAAGVPWFGTLFGRDSLTACLQTLAFDSEAAEGTLRLLARMQGSKIDPWTDEQPGRLLHEFRQGELARAGLIPYMPFYGTIDTNALFLILLAEHAAWTGSLGLFRELRGNVDRALEWMDRFADANGDGYLEYAYPSSGQQINQGWKDASDAIVTGTGRPAKSPISLVEVQAYAYKAKLATASLLRRNGEAKAAAALEAQAKHLRARFHRDFWMAKKRCFALALYGGEGRQADVVSSNPGQAMWGGILEPSRAAAVRDHLMGRAMFTGWGIRTLSSEEKSYNPVSYHLGSVWPHDNAFIAAGLRAYGFDADAMRVFEGLLAAAERFPERRLPELFCGFSQAEFPEPVRYPIACHPQAWASGSLPFLLTTLLGLRPDGFARRLRIHKPMLPEGCAWLEWRRLRVAGASVDLRFERKGAKVHARVLRRQGKLDVSS